MWMWMKWFGGCGEMPCLPNTGHGTRSGRRRLTFEKPDEFGTRSLPPFVSQHINKTTPWMWLVTRAQRRFYCHLFSLSVNNISFGVRAFTFSGMTFDQRHIVVVISLLRFFVTIHDCTLRRKLGLAPPPNPINKKINNVLHNYMIYASQSSVINSHFPLAHI